MEISSIYSLATGIFVGGAAGYIGSLMILQKMALVGDALSHVALPGIAVAILLNINPFIGAFFILAISILGIWALEKRTDLSMETLVGIFFTGSLALGLLITPEAELLEALFGDISKVSLFDMSIAILISIIVVLITSKISRDFLLSTISKDLAKSAGINTSRVNFIFLVLVAVIVAIGIKVVGTLLMGTLVIIPAASAKNISTKFKKYTNLSFFFGSLSAVSGIMIADKLALAPGPIIILSGVAIFVISLIFRKN